MESNKYIIPARRGKQIKGIQALQMENRMALIARKVLLSTAEHKVRVVSAGLANTSTAGTVINISNNIAEGDDIFNRSGTKVTITSIDMKYRTSGVLASQTTRFILFRDLMNQGTTPSVTDLLPNPTVVGEYSDTRYYQQSRFSVIDDCIIDVSATGKQVVTRRKKFLNVGKVLYNGATSVAASNGKGAVFLLVIGSAATGFYEYNATLLYNDS